MLETLQKNKQMKIKLHWQIVICTILGILFGIVFPTTYRITDQSIIKLKAANLPDEVINIVKSDKKTFTETEAIFTNNLQQKLDTKTFKKYKNVIIKAAKYNEYLPLISWLGELFLRALSMITIPLIISAIISSVANISENSNLAKVGIKTFFYYLSTGFLAIITALIVVYIIKPGVGAVIDVNASSSNIQFSLSEFISNLKKIIPINIFQSISTGHVLSIIFFSFLVGFFSSSIPKAYKKILIQFFNAFYELMMTITNYIVKFTPLGILGMMAVVVSEIEDFNAIFNNMSKYVFTVIIALLFHASVTLPFILKFILNTNPWLHYKAVRSALLTAFVTSSSSATLPMTMNLVGKNSGVSKKIAGFTLPLGTTVNIDGTALYELVTVLFIAQAYGIDLSIIEIIIVTATTILVSIGASNIPMTNLVIISIILNTVGLPIEGIALIAVVDRFLAMFKSAVKVWSDSCGAVIIAKLGGEQLKV